MAERGFPGYDRPISAKEHPHCAVTVVITPMNPEGVWQAAHTVTLTGVAGPIAIESEDCTIQWVPDDTGRRFTINGSWEAL